MTHDLSYRPEDRAARAKWLAGLLKVEILETSPQDETVTHRPDGEVEGIIVYPSSDRQRPIHQEFCSTVISRAMDRLGYDMATWACAASDTIDGVKVFRIDIGVRPQIGKPGWYASAVDVSQCDALIQALHKAELIRWNAKA